MVKITKQKLEKAIDGSAGIKTTIARRLGVTRKALYDYMNKYPQYRELIDNEEEKIIDMAEHSLYEQIRNNDFAATKFLLSTKGRRRGYTEKSEVEHIGGVTINLITKSNEEIKKGV